MGPALPPVISFKLGSLGFLTTHRCALFWHAGFVGVCVPHRLVVWGVASWPPADGLEPCCGTFLGCPHVA